MSNFNFLFCNLFVLTVFSNKHYFRSAVRTPSPRISVLQVSIWVVREGLLGVWAGERHPFIGGSLSAPGVH